MTTFNLRVVSLWFLVLLRILHALSVLVHLLRQIQYLGLEILIHLRHLIQPFIELFHFNTFTLLDWLNDLLDKLAYFLPAILLLIVYSELIIWSLRLRWSDHPLVHLIFIELFWHINVVLLHLLSLGFFLNSVFVIRLFIEVKVLHFIAILLIFIIDSYLLLVFLALTHLHFNFLLGRVFSPAWLYQVPVLHLLNFIAFSLL